MKKVRVLLLAATALFGQDATLQFTPVIDQPLSFGQVSDTYAWVQGNWVAMDENSKLPGVSVSEISCDRADRICHELQANILVMGNEFTVTPEDLEYRVRRWNADEIVAENISGICKVKNTLKFDRRSKRVYALQTLSEPVTNLPKMSQDICNSTGQNRWELHEKTLYRANLTR